MMQITLFDVSRQHLSLRNELRFLLSRLLSFHQLAHEESDGKTHYNSYNYLHLSLF